ncbi:MAG: amino acid racemase [Candidatus Methanomethylicia archaeon]|nr:amino acid racemase [Candidatus Methanomethylicia archaeon]
MKVIGILGGLGPEATAELFFRIIKITPAKRDQDHIPIIIFNNPKVPDRTAAILYGGENPLIELIKTAQKLEKAGVDFIIMPCNTAHYYYDELKSSVKIPFLNMIELTVKRIVRIYPNIKSVGLIATTGTIKSGLYQRYLDNYGIKAIIPSDEDQEVVMRGIYNGVKAGNLNLGRNLLLKVANKLIGMGAELIILGCTEVSIAIKSEDLSIPIIDPLQVLAEEAVKYALN